MIAGANMRNLGKHKNVRTSIGATLNLVEKLNKIRKEVKNYSSKIKEAEEIIFKRVYKNWRSTEINSSEQILQT